MEQVDDDELENIIERAREMEEHYGHYFDMIIIYRWNFLITVILLLVLQSCKRSVIWDVDGGGRLQRKPGEQDRDLEPRIIRSSNTKTKPANQPEI